MESDMTSISKYTDNGLYSQIVQLLEQSRQKVAIQVNTALVVTYWNIGRLIIEDEQNNSQRAEYGKQVLKELSKRLTQDFGKGFSRANLQWMRLLYIKYPICQTLSSKLTWSHYCELLTITKNAIRHIFQWK